MREYERIGFLERIEREGATVGARIPAEIELAGEPIDLRATVMALAGKETLTGADRDRIVALVRALRAHRRDRKRDIETGQCSRAQAEAIVETVAGIDRAIAALEDAGGPSVADRAAQRERHDRRRWMAFLREALGHDTGRRR